MISTRYGVRRKVGEGEHGYPHAGRAEGKSRSGPSDRRLHGNPDTQSGEGRHSVCRQSSRRGRNDSHLSARGKAILKVDAVVGNLQEEIDTPEAMVVALAELLDRRIPTIRDEWEGEVRRLLIGSGKHPWARIRPME